MKNNKEILNRAADNIRVLAASMVERAKSGHPGGAMGGADFINVLFSEFLTYDPDDAAWPCRDRFFLDPGHMSPMLYSQLALIGRFSLDELKQFRQWGSPTPGHPERQVERGIENTSGPLGQGHVYAVGAAIAAKALYARTGNPGFLREKVYAYISDGGVQEEISQGAGRLAGHLGLNNLIMFYDSNEIQLSTETAEVFSEDTGQKYRAWNWNVIEIDGNDCEQIREALSDARRETCRPTLIIGHCVMGKGALRADGTSYERCCATHGAPLGGDAYANTVRNLGGSLDEPFCIWPDVAQLYAARAEELRDEVKALRSEEQTWAETHQEKASLLSDWLAGRLPDIPWQDLQQKPNQATRAASSACLQMLAQHVPNMIVSSADLCNSDKTDGFLKGGAAVINRDDFSGGFLQAGVSELTMACVCIGMMLHGGIITAMGTFFVFSDYMKPAVRMAALMKVPVKFVWTHDAFRVGEDGPTHEPVEQEAQIRLMEKLRNHAGEDSVRVFRPCDVHDTTECWRLAMENNATPTALILSRQNLTDMPEGTKYLTEKGAYEVVHSDAPDVILVGSGSEVGTLVGAAALLKVEGVESRVVSCVSEGLFRRQDADYQETLLPRDARIFGLTAGLPVTLLGLVGAHGHIYGMESFGFSAPYKVLDEKLGFTPEHIAEEIKKYLKA
ncbi:MAG: transketolase [Bacteroidaceae bacterium]|nr:transketolase [Bacteroidaceae bacterium]